MTYYENLTKLEYVLDRINSVRKYYQEHEIGKRNTELDQLYTDADLLVKRIRQFKRHMIMTERVDKKLITMMEQES